VRCPVDITERPSIDHLLDAVVDHFGRVDILVNAAGRTARKATAEVDEEDWTAIIDTNLTGMLRACQSFYKTLKASRRARIINIASLASFVAFHEVAAYGASKAGVLALTRSLGAEWAPDGINVNAIVPGVSFAIRLDDWRQTQRQSGLTLGGRRCRSCGRARC
jgi:NAD(P)-dependent dehydrogenase (short-subunit alcohol dehydrogenase family)